MMRRRWSFGASAAALVVLAAAPASAAACLKAGLGNHPAPADWCATMAAAFGEAAPTRHAKPPRRHGEPPVALSLRPAALAPLAGGRYALVVAETDEAGAHVEPGAVGVAYLTRDRGVWRVAGSWPELAWSGNTGGPGDVSVRRDLGRFPMAVVSSSYMGQGQQSLTTAVISLASDRPRDLGKLPIGGSFETGNGCTICDSYDYRGTVRPARRTGEVLSVAYRGWRSPAKRPSAKRHFASTVGFRLQGGRLAPTKDLKLPDGTIRELAKP